MSPIEFDNCKTYDKDCKVSYTRQNALSCNFPPIKYTRIIQKDESEG